MLGSGTPFLSTSLCLPLSKVLYLYYLGPPKRHNITLQLRMATPTEGSNPSGRLTPRLLTQLRELEPRVARRRLSQARHRATLAGLFSDLRKTVYSHSDLTASKVWGPGGGRECLYMSRDCEAGGEPARGSHSYCSHVEAYSLGEVWDPMWASGCTVCGHPGGKHELAVPDLWQTSLARREVLGPG